MNIPSMTEFSIDPSPRPSSRATGERVVPPPRERETERLDLSTGVICLNARPEARRLSQVGDVRRERVAAGGRVFADVAKVYRGQMP